MFELAFNINGERFEVPSAAEHWRPRRVRDRGLEVVYKKDGIVPLMLPITATAEEFRTQLGNSPGKYRLDALDASFQPIDGMPAAYVVVPRCDGTGEPPIASAAPVDTAPRHGEMSETARLLSQVVLVNADMAKTIAERFSSVMDAAAQMLRAGAGIPVRALPEPRNGAPTDPDRPHPEDDDEAEDGDDQGDGDVFDKIDRVTRNVASTAEALSPLAMMLLSKAGLRNSGKKNEAKSASPSEPLAQAEAPTATTGVQGEQRVEPDEAIAPTADQMKHLMNVRAQLDPDEVEFLTEVYGELTPSEVNRWIEALSTMSVEDAVEHIRAQIRGGGASAEVA
jgi:hypothetical protein